MNLQEVKAPNLKYNQLTITMNAEEHEVDMDQHQQHQNVETNSLVIKYVYDCESEQSIRQLLFSKNLDIVFFKMYNQWTMGSPAKCFICFRAVHDSISAKQLLDQFVPVDEQIVQNRVTYGKPFDIEGFLMILRRQLEEAAIGFDKRKQQEKLARAQQLEQFDNEEKQQQQQYSNTSPQHSHANSHSHSHSHQHNNNNNNHHKEEDEFESPSHHIRSLSQDAIELRLPLDKRDESSPPPSPPKNWKPHREDINRIPFIDLNPQPIDSKRTQLLAATPRTPRIIVENPIDDVSDEE